MVYIQADGSLAAGMLYLRGGPEHRDDHWMMVDKGTGLPVWIDSTLRSARISGHGGSAWTGLPQRSQAGDLTVRPGPGWKVEGRSGRVSVELMGFVWNLSGEEPASRAAEGK